MKEENVDLDFKIIIIGDTGVGKTSILLNYTEGVFPMSHIATIGVEFKTKILTYKNYKIKLKIWDTAGQERFKSITKCFFKGASGILFVYDITNYHTFACIKDWIKDAEQITCDFKGVIVGNKIDMEDKRAVSKSELDAVSESKGYKGIEISAKNNINVNEVFELIAQEIIDKTPKEELISLYGTKEYKKLHKKIDNKKVKKKCCL